MAEHAVPTVHRFTREEYHDLARSGLFSGERVELLEGEIVHMAAKLAAHAFAVHRLTVRLAGRLGSGLLARFPPAMPRRAIPGLPCWRRC